MVAFSLILSIGFFSKYLVGRDFGILEWLGKTYLQSCASTNQ